MRSGSGFPGPGVITSTRSSWMPSNRCRPGVATRTVIGPRGSRLLSAESLVLETDEFNQFLVRHDPLVHADSPWTRIELRVVHRDVDFHPSVVHAPESFRELCHVAQWRPNDIEPATVSQPRGFDDERVTVPLANRVSIPPGLRIVVRQRTSIGEYLTHAGAGFVQNHEEARRLNELSRRPLRVELDDTHGEAVRLRIVLTVAGLSLLQKRSAFRLEWKPFLEVLRDVTEARERRTCRCIGRGGLIRGVSALPDAREVRLAICRSRHRPIEIGLTLCVARNALRHADVPLRDQRRRSSNRRDQHTHPDERPHIDLRHPTKMRIRVSSRNLGPGTWWE